MPELQVLYRFKSFSDIHPPHDMGDGGNCGSIQMAETMERSVACGSE